MNTPPHALLVSTFILDELRRVLRYPRLRHLHGFDDQTIDRVVVDLEIGAEIVAFTDDQVRSRCNR